MTIKEVVDFLNSIENKDCPVYINDCNINITDISHWTGDDEYIIIDTNNIYPDEI